jgi:hypothetical protein
MRAACLFVLLAFHVVGSVAFVVPASRLVSTKLYSSYADKLAAAQAAKAQKSGAAPAPAAQRAPPSPISNAPPAAAAVPFSEPLQAHLQDAISLLSSRLQSGQPLTREEYSRFETAIGAILVDALAHLGSAAAAAPAPAAPVKRAVAPPAAVVAPPQYQAPAAQADDDEDGGDDFESEGPAWNAEVDAKRFGVPVGTKNVSFYSNLSCPCTSFDVNRLS